MSQLQTITIAQAQINSTVGDIQGNLETILEYMERAAQAGAQVVTFPELALCGYPPEDLLLKPRFLADNDRALTKIVQASGNTCVVVGFAHSQAGRASNAAAVAWRGELLGIYNKRILPNYSVFDEVRYFTPGQGCLALQLDRLRLVLTICEDIWEEDSPVLACPGRLGAQITLNISASPFYAGKLAVRRGILAAYAQRTGNHIFYNNLVGGQDELVFDGGSMVMAPDGSLLASAKRFEQDLLLCPLTLTPPDHLPSVARPHALLKVAPPPAPEIKPTVAPEMERNQEILQALVLGTRDYVAKNGFKKVVLGLSGGVDSALTAAIAVQALGPDNVIGVTMPSQYTSQETLSDAQQLAQGLGIRLISVPIAEIYQAFLAQLAESFGKGPLGVEGENLQARIRGNILMALSNRFGWLVLTTGNKSETAVGYCTLYGDMAGGFAVIKDVPKTLVYQLSDLVNQQAGRDLIPASVMQRAPSAELRPDQKDEDSLPPYDLLDSILTAYVEEDKVMDEVVELGFSPEVVREVVLMVDNNEYKRRQAPPGLKITPKAFGKDRRLPITNRYRPGVDGT